jgi:hypothetical protein
MLSLVTLVIAVAICGLLIAVVAGIVWAVVRDRRQGPAAGD